MGEWDREIEGIEKAGETLIIAVRVFPKDKSASCHAVSFISIKGDLISEVDEYWADYGEVSEWRLSMKIGTSIKQIRFE